MPVSNYGPDIRLRGECQAIVLAIQNECSITSKLSSTSYEKTKERHLKILSLSTG